jgi:1-acyl-sn-glycerol-3-phosphate acyltransferase
VALLQPLPASSLPRRGGPLAERFGRLGLRLFRFRFAGDLPDVDRCVMIVAPHTSNWDFPLALCGMFALRLRASWLGKHTIFVGPLGALWQWMGGVPVDRSRPDGVVEAPFGPGHARPGAGGHPQGGAPLQERFPAHRGGRGCADRPGGAGLGPP